MAQERNTTVDTRRQSQLNNEGQYSSFNNDTNSSFNSDRHTEQKADDRYASTHGNDEKFSSSHGEQTGTSSSSSDTSHQESTVSSSQDKAKIFNDAMQSDLNLQDAQKEFELNSRGSTSSSSGTEMSVGGPAGQATPQISEMRMFKGVTTLPETVAKVEKNLIRDGIRTAVMVSMSQSESGAGMRQMMDIGELAGGIMEDRVKDALRAMYNLRSDSLDLTQEQFNDIIQKMCNAKNTDGSIMFNDIKGLRINMKEGTSWDGKLGPSIGKNFDVKITDREEFLKELHKFNSRNGVQVRAGGMVGGARSSMQAFHFNIKNYGKMDDTERLIAKLCAKDKDVSEVYKTTKLTKRLKTFGLRQAKRYLKQSGEAGKGLADTFTYAKMAMKTTKGFMAVTWAASKLGAVASKHIIVGSLKLALKLAQKKAAAGSTTAKAAVKGIEKTIGGIEKAASGMNKVSVRGRELKKNLRERIKMLNPAYRLRKKVTKKIAEKLGNTILGKIAHAVSSAIAGMMAALKYVIAAGLLLLTVYMLISGAMSAIAGLFDMGNIFTESEAIDLKVVEQLTEQLQDCYVQEMKSIYAAKAGADDVKYVGDNNKLFNHTKYKDQALYDSYKIKDIYPDDNSEELLAMVIVKNNFKLRKGLFNNKTNKAKNYIKDLFYNSHELEISYTEDDEGVKTAEMCVYVYYFPKLFEMKVTEGLTTIKGAAGLGGLGAVIIDGEMPEQVWQYLIDSGLSEMQTASIMGNLWGECGGDPNATEFSGYEPTCIGIGYGICQWTNTTSGGSTSWRSRNLWNYAYSKGESQPSLQTQLEYMLGEMGMATITGASYQWTSGWESKWEKACEDGNINKATYYFMDGWERPGIKRLETRQDYARKFYEKFN